MSLSQMAAVMGCTKATVSNIENARPTFNLNEDQAARLDEYFAFNGHFGRLVHYARKAHDFGWYGQYLQYEAKADVLKVYQGQVVPSLLQTEQYTASLFKTAGVLDIPTAVKDRMQRQQILARTDPPLLWVLLDECVLHRRVGGADVMRSQLEHLLTLGELPNVVIRIVPFDEGGYVGLDGSYQMLSGSSYEVVFVAAPEGGRLIEDAADVRRFRVRWDRIGAKALTEGASEGMIKHMIEVISG